MRLLGTIVGVIATAAALAPVAAGAQATALRPCKDGLRCTTVTVPLDRSTPAGRRLGLKVAVLPGTRPGAGALVMLTGGPGQAGLASIEGGPDFMRQLRRSTGGRTIVSVDQRGTGQTALRCAAIEAPQDLPPADRSSLAAAGAACAREIGPRRAFYTTGDSVADLEDIRSALGLERWSVGGVSYGTFVSTAYARTFPSRTDSLLLDSAVELEGVSGVDRDAFAAASRVIDGLCAGRRCPGVPDVRRATARLSAIMARRSVDGVLVGADGVARRRPFGGPDQEGALVSLLTAGDFSPTVRAGFPAAVQSALRGDASLLNRLANSGGNEDDDPRELSAALFYATTCEETLVPWRSGDPGARRRELLKETVAAEPAGTFAPFVPTESLGYGALGVCFGWPDARVYAPPADGIPASIPTLILSGGDDIRTSTESARSVAARSPSARVIVVPHRGHSVLIQDDDCVNRAVRLFYRGARVPGDVCEELTRLAEPLPVPPRSLASLPPAKGFPGRIGRTLTAVGLTYDDLDPSLNLAQSDDDGTYRGTGLRSGTIEAVEGDGLLLVRLDRFGYVPGVTVSGEIAAGLLGASSERLRIGGRGARGWLELQPGRTLTGVLDGRRVAARIGERGRVGRVRDAALSP